MGNKVKNGASVVYYNPKEGALLSGGKLQANAWYRIITLGGTGSVLPTGLRANSVFKTGGKELTLAAGDSVKPLLLGEHVAKTEIGIKFDEGVIDISDDASGGYNSYLLDGNVEFSGDIKGFTRYNEETEELDDVSADVFDRFVDKITDDGKGNYTFKSRENKPLLAFICLNRHARPGEQQHWLIMYQLFSSLDIGGGMKDAQKRDIAVKKAGGEITHYVRIAGKGDIL